MDTQNTKLIENLKGALQKCRESLEKISSTCCMPNRSTNMKEAFIELDRLFEVIEKSDMDNADVNLAIEGVGLFGSKVGWLYATCCTATREPMYQSIFKQLNIAHGNMWAILGVDH